MGFSFSKAVDKAISGLKDPGKTITEPLKAAKQEITNTGYAIAKPFEEISDQAGHIVQTAGDDIENVGQDISHGVDKGLSTGWGTIQEIGSDWSSDLDKGLSTGWNSVQEGWDEFRGEAGEAWEGLAAGAGGGVGGGAGGAGSDAAAVQADYQQQGLDYLKEVNALPRQFREDAMRQLAGGLGMEGGTGPSRSQRMQEISMGDEYRGQLGRAQESVLRGHSATGGARGGDARRDMAGIAPALATDIYDREQSGLNAMAFGLPSNSSQQAPMYGQIGQTLAQGQTADQMMYQQNRQNNMNMGLAGLTAVMSMFSDPTLKKDIKVVGKYKGLDWCEWTWNKAGEALGLAGKSVGVMADEVKRKYPHLVKEIDGKMIVSYEGLKNA
jgi:hypothetical protein